MFHHHALIGRETTVVKAEVKDHDVDGKSKEWPASMTVKLTYSAETREEIEYDKVKYLRYEAEAEGSTYTLKRFPHIIHSERRKLDGAPSRMPKALNGVMNGLYEHRVLNVIVQEELFNVGGLLDDKQASEFSKVVDDIAGCELYHILRLFLIPNSGYEWAYETNILHREESEGIIDVLNDFDLTIRVGSKTGSIPNQRTGTYLYIAMELMRAIECTHRFRHDLESIIYCIMDLTMAGVKVLNEEDKIVWGTGLWRWRRFSIESSASAKSAFLTNPITADFKKYRPGFLGFLRVVMKLKRLCGKAYYSLDDQAMDNSPTFDFNTCDGAIDIKKFREILRSYEAHSHERCII